MVSLFAALFTARNAKAGTRPDPDYTAIWLDDYYAISLNEYAISLAPFLPIDSLAPLW